ncbi:MAG: UDP-N-acetylmuramoyl-L-alanine--D-glutamate ligase [Rhodobacteraceae bacterium]|nr:UDP-N-acetylmuramoyl-L-alanine--D-glutamate ligase [Paracoccaceae bacterium]
MIALDHLSAARVGVLGLGRTGLSCCLALQLGGARVVAWDDSEDARQRASAAGIAIAELARPDIRQRIDRLIVSPGIPHLYPNPHPALVAAQRSGTLLDNDIGIFFEWLAHQAAASRNGVVPRTVAITGTNGKSTTAALTAHILSAADVDARLAGNIGRPVLELEGMTSCTCVVLEVSSYQSDLAAHLAPDVAVFLNLAPDHLSRHGGVGGYFAAKKRLFDGPSLAAAMVGVDEGEGEFLAAHLRSFNTNCKVFEMSACGRRTIVDGAVFSAGKVDVFSQGKLQARFRFAANPALRGLHNGQNAAAAAIACRYFGLPNNAVAEGLMSFPGLPHRMQLVGRANGITVVNDSKATNFVSAERALEANSSILWIAGGQAKETGIGGISRFSDRVRKAYLIGSCAEDFAIQLDRIPHSLCRCMETAVAMAIEDACPGDTILLSPAAASFDQYRDFEHRGDHFVELTRRLLLRHAKAEPNARAS